MKYKNLIIVAAFGAAIAVVAIAQERTPRMSSTPSATGAPTPSAMGTPTRSELVQEGLGQARRKVGEVLTNLGNAVKKK